MDIPDNYYTIKEITSKFKMKDSKVRSLIKENMLPNTIKKKSYFINIEDVENYLSIYKDLVNYVDIPTAAHQLRLHPESIRGRIRKGEIKKVKWIANKYYIHKEEIEALATELELRKEYLGIQEVASILSCHTDTVRKLLSKGKFPNFIKRHRDRLFLIPHADVEKYKKELALKKNLIGKNSAAKRLKISEAFMKRLLERGVFPNAIKHSNNRWSIPLKDLNDFNVEDYKIKRYKPIKDGEFTNLDAINKVKFEAKGLTIPSYLKDTYRLYLSYVEHRFSHSSARSETLEKKSVYTANTLKYLLINLDKDITAYSDREIEMLLGNKETVGYVKENFVSFLSYCKRTTLCAYKNKYSITNKVSKEATPYTKEQFFDYYNYIKKTTLHLNNSVGSHRYTQAWLFIIMHFINAWRKSDIIYELPCIDVEEIGISTIDYFKDNELTFIQSQSIVNQVYSKVDKFEISKTGALGQFLCPKDMVIPFATAATIAELHRRSNNKDKLLYAIKHGICKQFFDHSSTLNNFSSIKMNHSLLTYFFDYIIQETEDADIAYELSRNLRSHMSEDTTMLYIHSTNKDGHINKVSSHLFRRGHFGWLYNSMIKLAQPGELNIYDKTSLIEDTRKFFSPVHLENLSYSLLLEQKHQISLIQRLLTLSKKEIKEKINAILCGEAPAKIKHAQCFVYPHCSKSHDCLSCEFLIPKDYLLFSIDNEIKMLIKKIENANLESMKIKYGYLLLNTLNILNQAVIEVGKEYVQTFVNLREIENSLREISDTLTLTSTFTSFKE